MPAPNEHWKWTTLTEEAVILSFGGDTNDWKTSEAIGASVRLINSRDLQVILRHMVDRNILESQAGKGFRLKNPPKI